MNPFKVLRNILVALQGGGDPRHAAAGFALGAALGLVPKGNLMAAAFLVLFFFFRVDKPVALASALLFTPLGYLADGAAHALGLALLSAGALKPLWTFLYGLPVVPLTKFNNTVVLGNLVIGLALFVPLYLGSLRFVHFYRERWKPVVDQWRVVRWVKGLYFWRVYEEWTA